MRASNELVVLVTINCLKSREMPQVSRRNIDKRILARVSEIFFDSFLCLKTKEDVAGFLDVLLTKTEKMMVAKRLSISILLAKGYDYDSIKDILKVSQGTISSVKDSLSRSDGDCYRKIVDKILKEDKIKKLFLTLEEVINFLPPKGRDWSAWGKRKWERNIRKQDPL